MSNEDFSVDSLAAYLHLSPSQVSRLAEREQIPGRKVAGQWRFAAADVHHWLEHRLGLLEEQPLAHVESVLDRSAPAGEAPVLIAELLPVEAIAVPLAVRTRRSVIDSMAQLAAETGLLWDAAGMAEAVQAREELQPTAMENGVALLHPRRPMANIIAEPHLALGVTAGGIPFGGARGALTDVFFLVCSIDDRGHLRTLAKLSRIISRDGFLSALRQAPDAQAAHRALVEYEAELDD